MSRSPHHHDQPGEFELIARLTDGLRVADDVERGVGDDAALVNWRADRQMVVTCDAQVEDSHFKREYSSPEQIGRRALSVNLSDMAAMGARPRYALISLILRPDSDLDWLERMYFGLRAQAEAFGVSIIGGNVASSAGPVCIDVTLIGEVASGRAVRRDGAHVGDRIYVSGYLGAAAAGLASLRADASAAPNVALREVWAAYRDPQPQVALGEALSASGAVTAMIDISDGFSADLHHLCDESDVAAVIDEQAVPISDATRLVAAALGASPLELALSGGDDYQLLFAVSHENEAQLAALPVALEQRVRPIGWVTAVDAGVRLRHPDGTTEPLHRRGWDHLRGPLS